MCNYSCSAVAAAGCCYRAVVGEIRRQRYILRYTADIDDRLNLQSGVRRDGHLVVDIVSALGDEHRQEVVDS